MATSASDAFNTCDCAIILGGSRARELAAARLLAPFAKAIILSSGALTQDELCAAVRDAGGQGQCRCDRTALDTVTNFTSLVAGLVAANVKSTAVVTDAAHYRRAIAVGRIVLGWSGICVHGLRTPSLAIEPSAESIVRVVRDVLRAILWVFTGLDGTALAALVHPRRAADVLAWRSGRPAEDKGAHDEALARWLTAALGKGGGTTQPAPGKAPS